MSIIRWNPGLRGFVRAQDPLDRLFDPFLDRVPYRTDAAAIAPPVDVEESAEEFVVRADMPGMSQKDFKVSLMGDTLTIRGERRQATTHKDGNLHRTERVHGTFERSFVLGTPVRGDQIKASYRDGVLEVRVPKAEEARMREIEVQVA